MRTLTLFFLLVEVSYAGLMKHSHRDVPRNLGPRDAVPLTISLPLLLSSILGTQSTPSTQTTASVPPTSPTPPLSSPPPSTPLPSKPPSNPPSSSPSSPSTPTSSHKSSLTQSDTSKIPQASGSPSVSSSGSVPSTIAAVDATEAPANTPAPSTTSLSAGSKHTSHASVIAGVLVPLLIIALAAALFIIHHRRRRRVRPNGVFDRAVEKREADPPPPEAPVPDASCEEENPSQGWNSTDSLPVLSEKDSGLGRESNLSSVSAEDGATPGDTPTARDRASHALSRAPTFVSHWSRPETPLPPYTRPLPAIPPLSTMPPLPTIPPT